MSKSQPSPKPAAPAQTSHAPGKDLATAPKRVVELDVRPDNLTLDTAIVLCQQRPVIAGQFIMALIAQNTAALPGTAFVRRADNLYLKKQRQGVRLTERDGHLLSMSKPIKDDDGNTKWIKVYDLSMNGLRKLNELPALQIIRPEFVIVNGQKQMNPYIQVDPVSKMPEVVYARCLCVGYSPMGSLVATDAMVRLDVNIYLLENIQSKMKRLKVAAGTLGQYGSADEPPLDHEGKKLPGRWRFMPLHSVGGIGLWVNLAAPEAQEILQDHTTRVKFIERLAQSFAERNALKSHPSIPKTINAQNGVATVTVTGWTTDFARTELEKLRELIENNKLEEFKDRDGRTIDCIAVEVDVPTEEDIAAMNEEADGQRGVERAEGGDKDDEHEEETPAPKEAEEDLLAKATSLFSMLIDAKGRAFAKTTLKDTGADTLEDASPEELAKFIEKCGEMGVKA
jgi:hypothetical protein